MKKILIVIDSLTGGGAEKVLVDILKKLDKKKYIVDLFLFNKKGVYIEEAINNCNSLNFLIERKQKYDKNIFMRKLISLFFKIKLYLVINGLILKNRNKYDIEIAFLEGKSTEYVAKRKSKSKKIAWVHTDLKKHRVLGLNQQREVYKNIDNIVCVSNDSKKSLIDLYPEFSRKTRVIYNMIPKDEIVLKSLQEKIEFQNEKITCISVGRLTHVKGYDILLKAHKKLLDEGLDYNLKILGDGPLKKELQEYLVKNNLENNTELLGFKKNPYPYIKKSDIYIMSSRYEGFPLVLCEALVLGKPIIATKCTGPIEILDNGKYGNLVEIENVEELAKSMKGMILNIDRRKKYQDLSKNREVFFDEKQIKKQIEDLLDGN